MDLVPKRYQIHQIQSLSPIKSPHLHHSNPSFPILAVAIIGILTTALLLISYYIFVIKCCLNWHRIDLLGRFSLSRNRNHETLVGLYSPGIQRRGLDESVIQSIPVIQFRKGEKRVLSRERSFKECAVCLNEFQEEEKLRAIPNCAHLFHVDCIDVWLQGNENCPLCRRSISIPSSFQVVGPSSSLQNPCLNRDNFIGCDEDYVVIELGNPRYSNPTLSEESLKISTSPNFQGKLEPKVVGKKGKKLNHVSSMGDECIDIRGKDDQFAIQPIRRSFSMDSANDRQLYLAVQEIIQQNRNGNETGLSESSSTRVRRSFFSFGSGRGSRSAVLPVESEP